MPRTRTLVVVLLVVLALCPDRPVTADAQRDLQAVKITTAANRIPQAPPLPKDTLPTRLNLTGKRLGLPTPPGKIYPLDEKIVTLGRKLFFSPKLSRDGTVSCASCHRPDHGFAASDPTAIGIAGKRGPRNTPTLLNVALGKSFFWDGRAESLETQALKPIQNPIEMNHRLDRLIDDIRADKEITRQFASAFAGRSANSEQSSVTAENLAIALATFQRTLLSGNSPVDRFRRGEYNALTAKQRQGLWLFESRAKCWRCHSGPNFTDDRFHNTGVGYGTPDRDEGRFAVTKEIRDRFAFKTPTLRDVAKTAPYMHDGGTRTLREVIDFYNAGGHPDDPNLDRLMTPLGLSDDEVGQLIEFLKALSSGSGARSPLPASAESPLTSGEQAREQGDSEALERSRSPGSTR